MAFNAASFGVMPSSMWRSTPSTTTIASSTTRPMASTRPNRESVLMEKPNTGKSMNVPTSDTGTASSGIRVARQPCKKRYTTRITSASAIKSVIDDFLDSLGDRARGIERDVEIQVVGEALLHLSHELLDPGGSIHRVRPRQLVGGDDGAGLAIEASRDTVVLGAQLDPSDIADADNSAVGRLADDDLPEFFRGGEAALRQNRVGEFRALGRRFAARLTRGVHGVLRLNGADDFRDGDSQLRQGVGFYPQAHRVLTGAEHLNVADTGRA